MVEYGIVIPHFGLVDDTRETVQSISSSRKGKSRIYVVVDKKDLVRVSEALKSLSVIYLPTETNSGFAGGCNSGLRQALEDGAETVTVLNNDVKLDEDTIPDLSEYVLSSEAIGVVSPKIYFYPGGEYHKDRYAKKEKGRVIWYAGGLIDWNNVLIAHRGMDEVDRGDYEKIRETDFATGCCMAFSRSIIEKIGFFDEKYFLYFEDVDYSLRARQAGFKVIYYPKVHLWHKNASSSGKPGSDVHIYYQTRNRLYFGMKYSKLRTKAALLRESVRYLINGGVRSEAVRDYYTRRMGEKKK